MQIKIKQARVYCDIGCNMDKIKDYFWPSNRSSKIFNPYCNVFIICDGIGEYGEIASQIVSESLGNKLKELIDGTHSDYIDRNTYGIVTEEMFNQALTYASDDLDKVTTETTKLMGTTMACLVLHRGGALVAHIGNSRIYQVRPSLFNSYKQTSIIYQSRDHSFVNDLVHIGEITEEEAKYHPKKNALTRIIQSKKRPRHPVEITNIDDVQSGDFFLLCSDGLLEQITNKKLEEILSRNSMDDEGKFLAINEVCNNKTTDNYTYWLIPIDSVEKSSFHSYLDEGIEQVDEHKYDVFISCKSEDYKIAQPFHDFFVQQGLRVFFADSELKQIAESQYADVIDEALDATKHLVVVASSLEHIKSKWVKYEWSTFSNDLKSGYRDGNLITIITPSIELRKLPASLRHMQSFFIETAKDEILPYLKR